MKVAKHFEKHLSGPTKYSQIQLGSQHHVSDTKSKEAIIN